MVCVTHIVRVAVLRPDGTAEQLVGEGVRTGAPLVPPGETLVVFGAAYRVLGVRQELLGYGSVDEWVAVTTYQVEPLADASGDRAVSFRPVTPVPQELLEGFESDAV